MLRLLPALALFGLVFFVFAYNSGYGYDATEYLYVARSLDEHRALYDFIPSKSYLIYSSTHVLLGLLGGYNHVSISLLITLLAMSVVVSAYWAVRQLGNRAAALGAGLTALTCFFTEMNFLEPESWIALTGLLAFGLVIRNGGRASWRWLGAGALLGVGMCFKSVAAFYMVGFAGYLTLLWLTGHQTFGRMVGRGLLTLLGFLLPLGLSATYFYATGRLNPHIEWTYIYPFGGYPSHTLFLAKFLVKLSWLLGLLAVSLVLVWLPPYRRQYAQTPALWLALLLGVFACASLLKTQASHYFFPAAVFFNVHLGFLIDRFLTNQSWELNRLPRVAIAGAVVLVIGLGAGLWLYRPDAVRRFTQLADYRGEVYNAGFIRQQVGPGGKALIFDNAMMLYFLSDVVPNVPFINTEMQTTHYIDQHPDTYARALADTSLKLIIIDNRAHVIDDSTAAQKPANVYALRQLREGLDRYFRPGTDSTFLMKYWVRK
ncbi:glycosyltransferase family 39 protein [Spirosoma rhododendri]|uniref:Glycosyltransferase RgtA/B/C/D-like domain-containing protein n=1 Tax=Spirosoma rhododendri TaxID=2728024 RepID=A0A7L5DSH8_9BACT|nr:glycosyltransferase family 39 protein [Spirosoma rhododendri]QJD80203.1 hypothetical protein HH216_18620 [Spirosoma rhododendri]